MFRNVLIAALRNLMRNRLYAAISIVSLAIGMAAALLTFVYVRDELTFAHFVPGHEKVFQVRSFAVLPVRGPVHLIHTIPQIADWVKQAAPEVQVAARTWVVSAAVRRGGVEASERLVWA